jgi:hypothetical protein
MSIPITDIFGHTKYIRIDLTDNSMYIKHNGYYVLIDNLNEFVNEADDFLKNKDKEEEEDNVNEFMKEVHKLFKNKEDNLQAGSDIECIEDDCECCPKKDHEKALKFFENELDKLIKIPIHSDYQTFQIEELSRMIKQININIILEDKKCLAKLINI